MLTHTASVWKEMPTKAAELTNQMKLLNGQSNIYPLTLETDPQVTPD